RRIGNIVNLRDAIARLKSCFRSGRIVLDPADYGGVIQKNPGLEAHHVDAGQQKKSEKKNYRPARSGGQKKGPERMREKFRGIAGALVHRVLATHLDVAAKRKRIDTVVGIAFLESHQALTKTNGELFDAHAQHLGDSVVSKFVDQDHESQNHDQSD